MSATLSDLPLARPHRPVLVAGTLDELTGPTAGVVELPLRLWWQPDRRFDLDQPTMLEWMYENVLREAIYVAELRTFLDKRTLVRIWPQLNLPRAVRAAWETRHPRLRLAAARQAAEQLARQTNASPARNASPTRQASENPGAARQAAEQLALQTNASPARQAAEKLAATHGTAKTTAQAHTAGHHAAENAGATRHAVQTVAPALATARQAGEQTTTRPQTGKYGVELAA